MVARRLQFAFELCIRTACVPREWTAQRPSVKRPLLLTSSHILCNFGRCKLSDELQTDKGSARSTIDSPSEKK